MARVYFDRVLETTTSTGTGDLVVLGGNPGYQAFGDVCEIGDTFDYAIYGVGDDGVPTGEWETGRGVYNNTNIISRTTIQESSNNDARINFSAGIKYIMLSQNAQSFRELLGGETTYTSTHGEHAYWAVTTGTTQGSGYFGFAECQMRATPGGLNQCLGGTATSNTGTVVGNAANGFDGNPATDFASGAVATRVAYHFNGPVEVAEVSLQCRPAATNEAPTLFNVEYSDDGTTWTTAWQVATPGTWIAGETRIFTDPGLEETTGGTVIYLPENDAPSIPNNTSYSDPYATTGVHVVPAENLFIGGLYCDGNWVVGRTIQPVVYRIDNTTGAFLEEIAVGPVVSTTTEFTSYRRFMFSGPVQLLAQTRYAIALRRTDANDDSPVGFRFFSGTSVFTKTPMSLDGTIGWSDKVTPTLNQAPDQKGTGMPVYCCGVVHLVAVEVPTIGGGGIADAPADGATYSRKDGEWVAIDTVDDVGTSGIADATSNGQTFGRKDGAWVVLDTVDDVGITDALSDSTLYARKNGAWVAVPTTAKPWYFSPPLAASLTKLGTYALTLADDADVGLIVTMPLPSTSNPCGAGLLLPASNWNLTAKLETGYFHVGGAAKGAAQASIGCWNTAANRFMTWGLDSRDYIHFVKYNATIFDGLSAISDVNRNAPTWFRLVYLRATGILERYISWDGKSWMLVGSRTVQSSDFSGVHPTYAGLVMNSEGYVNTHRMTVPHMTLITF